MKDVCREEMWEPNLLRNEKYLKSRKRNKNKSKNENENNNNNDNK